MAYDRPTRFRSGAELVDRSCCLLTLVDNGRRSVLPRSQAPQMTTGASYALRRQGRFSIVGLALPLRQLRAGRHLPEDAVRY